MQFRECNLICPACCANERKLKQQKQQQERIVRVSVCLNRIWKTSRKKQLVNILTLHDQSLHITFYLQLFIDVFNIHTTYVIIAELIAARVSDF